MYTFSVISGKSINTRGIFSENIHYIRTGRSATYDNHFVKLRKEMNTSGRSGESCPEAILFSTCSAGENPS